MSRVVLAFGRVSSREGVAEGGGNGTYLSTFQGKARRKGARCPSIPALWSFEAQSRRTMGDDEGAGAHVFMSCE